MTSVPQLVSQPGVGMQTGPANGIQLQHGPHQGRLVIPANHSIPHDDRIVDGRKDLPADYYRSHVVFSDDGGQTWQLGGTHEPYTNESTVVELFDGVLMQNMRSYHGCRRTEEGERVDCLNRRAVATSRNGGISWSPVRLDQTLVEPICQASLFRYSWADTTHPRGILLFSNPASSTSRDHMTVRASFDDGTTWPVHRVIEQGPRRLFLFGQTSQQSHWTTIRGGERRRDRLLDVLPQLAPRGLGETFQPLSTSR